MSDGQIALNTAAASAGLFFKDSNGDLVKTGPVHIGTTAPNSTPATGGSTGNSKGEAWLDTANGNYVLKIYDGTAWRSVEIAAGSARQLLQTNAAGTDVEFTSNVDVPGTLDVTGATTLDSTASVAGLLSANGKISFAEGNAAAPGIYPGSDTDTGISSPSLNELSFSTAGTSRLHIASDGKVGVGTAPSGNLDVMSTSGRFLVRTDQSNLCLDSVNTANSAFSDLRIRAENILFQSSGTEHVRITDSGNVGIGTSTTNAKLDIIGDANDSILPNNAIFKFKTGGGNGLYMGTRSSSPYQSYIQSGFHNHNNNSVPYSLLLNPEGGNVGIGTSSPTQKLEISSSNPRLKITDNNTTASTSTSYIEFSGSDARSSVIYTDSNGFNFQADAAGGNAMRFLTNGSNERMRIDSSGNVGIGTSAIDGQLEVRSSAALGIISRSTNTQGTDTNKALKVRNNSDTDTFTVSYRGRGYFANNVGIGTSSPVSKVTALGINGGGEGGTMCVQNTATGVNTNVALYLCPNNGGGNDLQRTAAIKSRQEVAGNYANLEFYTSQSNTPTERMRIDVSGRLLIGTPTTLDTSYQTAGGNLQVVNAALPVILGDYNNHQYGPRLDFVKTRAGVTNGKTIVAHNDQLGNIIWGGADGTNIIPAATITANVDGTPGTNDMPGRLVFLTTADGAAAPAERMRITQAGRVGIATSNPGAYLHVNSGGQATSSLNTGGDLSLIVSDGGTAVNNGGSIVFAAASGSWRFAAIKGLVTDGANNARGDIAVCTRGSSTDSTLTERARISREGHFYIHTTSIFPGSGNTATGAMFEKAGDGTTSFVSRDNNVAGYFNRNSDGNLIRYMRSGNEVGRISITSSNTSYLTTSDYRLKENVVNISDGITRVKQLAPKRFNFIADADTTVDGFLAHEAQAVVPEAVHGAHNEVDDEGNPVMQGIDQSKLVPLLTAALQEAIAKIETLEQRLNDAGL